MFFRVRTTLPDRPGALARLTRVCGDAEVNIVALQVFRSHGVVTDELVLMTPDATEASSWTPDRVRALLLEAGGEDVVVAECTPEAATDQPTRYVEAARAVIAEPASFPEVVAHLFDADVRPSGAARDVVELVVGDVEVQLRRDAAFTGVERARAGSMAALVSDVLAGVAAAEADGASPLLGAASRRLGDGESPDYAVDAATVSAVVAGVTVGRASVGPGPDDEDATVGLSIDVEPSWRRRGVGTRLLAEGARLARRDGAEAVLLTTAADNRAVLPMVLAAGMRGRIRMTGDTLTVRIPVTELRV